MKSSHKLILVPKCLLWWNTFILADRLETIQTILDLPQKLITVSWLAASNLSTTSHWNASRFCELTNNKRRAGKRSGATKSSCTDGSRLRHPRPRRPGQKIQLRFSPARTPSWGFFFDCKTEYFQRCAALIIAMLISDKLTTFMDQK